MAVSGSGRLRRTSPKRFCSLWSLSAKRVTAFKSFRSSRAEVPPLKFFSAYFSRASAVAFWAMGTTIPGIPFSFALVAPSTFLTASARPSCSSTIDAYRDSRASNRFLKSSSTCSSFSVVAPSSSMSCKSVSFRSSVAARSRTGEAVAAAEASVAARAKRAPGASVPASGVAASSSAPGTPEASSLNSSSSAIAGGGADAVALGGGDGEATGASHPPAASSSRLTLAGRSRVGFSAEGFSAAGGFSAAAGGVSGGATAVFDDGGWRMECRCW
mmetsp:Transcript_19918/g.64150  ORF Transcript_19918/g.64150 Transcript_19918/m.64150 type:complete len:272 (-) Transcript_19918:551-1366(-)